MLQNAHRPARARPRCRGKISISKINGIQSQISQIEQQIAQKDVERQQNAGQIAVLEARINTIPNVKVALEGVNARYQSAKQTYDEILKKKNDAETVVGVETNPQGETIRVQDPANVPQSPVAPKRFLLTLLGAASALQSVF